MYVQGTTKVGAPGLVNLIAAVAYHFCPMLPAAFTQPGVSALADLCMYQFSKHVVYCQYRFPQTPPIEGLSVFVSDHP